MKTIKVFGQRNDALKAVEFGDSLENFSVSDAVLFTSDRDEGNAQLIKDLKEDDVVELIFEDNIHRWVTVKELEEEFKYQISRGEDADVLVLPDRLPSGDTTRGAVSWVLTGLRVLKYDPVERSVKGIAELWDKKLMPEPGLFRYKDGLKLRGDTVDDQTKINTAKPVLLFIHGTFSSTSNGFGSLLASTWAGLQEKYGDQIFGFDHRTLSVSPIQNTLELVQRLPEKSKLHLITHSRGGLIGELLSRSQRVDGRQPFDEDDKRLSAEEGEALAQLSDLMTSKQIVVERFVRVACPARGTTLASNRVDRWLEIIVNVMAKVLPPGPGNIWSVIADLLLEVKKQSANPAAMPGLAAMNPTSNFIKMINRADVQVETDLTVIAGDVDKNNLLGRLAVFFTDLFYFEEHDLVVQTPAMYGGPTREAGRFFFDKGAEVNHFNYFSNLETAEKIEQALLDEPENLTLLGFKPIREAYVKTGPEVGLRGSYQLRSSIPQPVVYLLPGIMGTHLSDGDNRIWIDLLDLTRGRLANLQINNKNVQPQALVALAYARLVRYLSATHEVIPFPFDWRLSILEEAGRFADALETKLEETDQPIRIIGHSMGGLVTRAMIASRPEVWKKIREREGARFIMLGTPNKGSFMIPRLILGLEKTFRILALVDIHHSPMQLLEVITRFPGVLQLLPMEDSTWDFVQPKAWDTFPNGDEPSWLKPRERDLAQTREFQQLFKTQKVKFTREDPVLYVAGHAPGAPVGVEIDKQGEVVFQATDKGDGTVPWETGIPPELKDGRTYYMDAGHGDLANHKADFAAIYDLLTEGETERLARVPPSMGRGEEEIYTLRDEQVEIYPTQQDLERTVLATEPVPLETPAVKPVRVSVAHGNLSFCRDAVAVGHYEGDSLYSAEKALDRHLSGRLTERHMLGLYPGPEGTVEVVLNDPGEKPGGAIVVGLGKAGELSPHKLTYSFAMALREYAVKAHDNNLANEQGEISISSLLIGTSGMGLSVTNSVGAILNAVQQANKSFAQVKLAPHKGSAPNFNIRVAEIQFIELFKDQAILATRALNAFRNNPAFDVDPYLRTLRGGWERIAYIEPPGWWNRIRIRADKNADGALIFSVPTERARAEESRLGVQRRNIDRMITDAVRTPNWDQELATAMFELLIPLRLKGSFKDMNNIIFVVDEEAASYPWELLYDQRTGEEEPLVIQNGMVRQFTTSVFKEKVVDVKNKDVMVVGNPKDLPPNFADLPGAQQEAILVADMFEKNGYQVRRAIHSDSTSIMNKLFSKDYRVLHLAGHGVYHYTYKHSDRERPEIVTGMVLGNGVFLTANEMENKENIPELVFINCCHLAKIERDGEAQEQMDRDRTYAFNKFAASLSRQLINMGVKAVVAAGWAVDDAAALNFAEAFYDRLLRGFTFGEAIKEARIETYNLHKDRTNTWAAYQCYGDPAYRLVPETKGGPDAGEQFVDVAEVVVEVMQLFEKAQTASTLGTRGFKDQLKQLHKNLQEKNPGWLDNPELLEALGKAYAEVFMFEQAVDCYDRAIQHGKSVASIKAIEQAANCHIRLAVQRFEQNPDSYVEGKKKIEAQIVALDRLMETLGETPERLAMKGSGYKRLAQIASKKPSEVCNKALEQMETYYRQAWELTKEITKGKKQKDPYTLINALVARIALLVRLGDQKQAAEELEDLKRERDEARRYAEGMQEYAPESFWAAVGIADVELLDHLIGYLSPKKNKLPASVHDSLVEEYRKAWKQFGSQRELNSVIEQYDFLVAVLKEFKDPEDSEDNLCDVFEKTLGTLQAMSEEVD